MFKFLSIDSNNAHNLNYSNDGYNTYLEITNDYQILVNLDIVIN